MLGCCCATVLLRYVRLGGRDHDRAGRAGLIVPVLLRYVTKNGRDPGRPWR
jgi:hypothetical protein